MENYYFFELKNGDKMLLYTWDHKPSINEIMNEVNQLNDEYFDERGYVRVWNNDEGTMFDFGSWSVFGFVTPQVYDLFAKNAELGTNAEL